MYQITNNEFLEVIFSSKGSDEYLWINQHVGNPAEYNENGKGGQFWAGKRIQQFDECPSDAKNENAYFSVSSLKTQARRIARAKQYASGLAVVVLDDANNVEFTPTYQLETSAGNYQVGLKLDEPISDVEVSARLMSELVRQNRVASDKNGNNVVRYARLPCGSNGKYEPPYRHQMIQWNPERTFTLQEVCDFLELDFNYITTETSAKANKAPIALKNLPVGLDNMLASDRAVNDLAMTNFSAWVRELFPQVKESGGNYRVTSQSLGRPLQEDISIHVDGIKDFGVADQGDARSGKRTPIELVAEHQFQNIANVIEAEIWLRERLGLPTLNVDMDSAQLALMRAGTEHATALAYKQRYTGQLKFNVTTKKWLIWDGKCWVVDELNQALHRCRQLATKLCDTKTSHRHSFFKGVEAICKSDPEFAISNSSFDADNYLLNTPDGVVDLRNGVTRPHEANLLLSKITLVGAANDYGVRFPQFLDEITCGDGQMKAFLQVSLGACLSGAIESHWMLFWIGSGRNGKNTLGDAVMKILGDYARKIPARVLMATKNEGHPTEIAQLWGARLAIGSEVEQTSFWSESKLNELTGDDTIAGRFMGCDWFTFPKTWKFLIYGNHRPRLNSITPAIKARIKIVPFNADFSQNGDPDLPTKLRKEYPNILKWLIDGHRMWLDAGKKLPVCDAINAELNDYMNSQATVENWMDDFLEHQGCIWTNATELYQHYSDWKHQRGEHPNSQVVWSEAMKKRYKRKRTNTSMAYEISLKKRLNGLPERDNPTPT